MANTGQKARDLNVPPRIIVYAVEDIRPIQDLLQEAVGDEYSMKILANDQVEIQLKDEDKIEAVTDALKSKHTIFEVKKKKKEEKYKVVLRNMHPSVDVEQLTRELEAHGHKVISISNLKDATTKEPMPLFSVELEPKENNEDIYEVTKLSNMIVAFEPQNQKKKLPGCIKCQSIGHKESSNAEKLKKNAPSSNASSESTSTPTSSKETPIAYVQPIRSRAPKTRRPSPPSPSEQILRAHLDSAQEQMATLNRLISLEAIVNSTISSLESMCVLASTLNQRLN